MEDFNDWCAISNENCYAVGIRCNGTMWTIGINNQGVGVLGVGDDIVFNKSSPVSVVGGFADWCQASAGGYHSLGLRTNGTLWAWGCNYHGRLGDCTLIDRSSPVSVVGGFTDWCQVSAGHKHSLGLRTNGTLWAWGYELFGGLGQACSILPVETSPVSVIGGYNDWCCIVAGSISHLAIRSNGTLWAWGAGRNRNLGMGNVCDITSPVSVLGGFTDWCQVVGGYHTLGLRSNGTLWAWGLNCDGQLGTNNDLYPLSPVSVVGGFTDWCSAAVTNKSSVAVRTNGTLWAWGSNSSGRLGDGTTTSRSSPVSVVGGFTDWCQVVAGYAHTIGVRCNGTLWTWGANNYGQLGDNTTISRSSPVSVIYGFGDWTHLAAGYSSTFVIKSDGTMWGWGYNYKGQLGDGTTTSRSSPVSVVGGFTDWCQVSSRYHTVGLRRNGTLWAWGSNEFSGALGNGETFINKSSPVSVIGGFTDWCQVKTGASTTMALKCDGTIWMWGDNFNNTCLGIGEFTSASSPLSITPYSDWVCVNTGSKSCTNIAIRRRCLI
jgi:alpha-tubulin suppressor-like RCC1 family protein